MARFETTPFLKWPGGKRWLVAKYSHYIPRCFQRYFEPFLGSAAMFFYLQPPQAVLSDINSDLITLYRVMRDNHLELAQVMQMHQELHCKDYYYLVRSQHYDNPIQSAGRFLYLNRMCYNGMYRVNKFGHFNVPIGTKQNCIFDLHQFSAYSMSLKNVEICSCDFNKTIDRAGNDDFIFVDPPYTISHNQNSFIKYNEQLFTWSDQQRLLKTLCAARSRGAKIIATNANYDAIKTMYADSGFFIKPLKRFSVMSAKAEKRQEQEELLISSNRLD